MNINNLLKGKYLPTMIPFRTTLDSYTKENKFFLNQENEGNTILTPKDNIEYHFVMVNEVKELHLWSRDIYSFRDWFFLQGDKKKFIDRLSFSQLLKVANNINPNWYFGKFTLGKQIALYFSFEEYHIVFFIDFSFSHKGEIEKISGVSKYYTGELKLD